MGAARGFQEGEPRLTAAVATAAAAAKVYEDPPVPLVASAGAEGGEATRKKTGIGSLALGPPAREDDSDSDFDEEDTPLVMGDEKDGNSSFTAALRNIPSLNVSSIEISKAESFKRMQDRAKFERLRQESDQGNFPDAREASPKTVPENHPGRSRGIEAARALKNALRVQSQLAGSRQVRGVSSSSGSGSEPVLPAQNDKLTTDTGPSEEQRRKAKALLGAVSKARALGARASSKGEPEPQTSAAAADVSFEKGPSRGSSRESSRAPSPSESPAPAPAQAEAVSVGEAMAQAARERKERSRKTLEKQAERRNVSVQDFSELFSFCRHGKYKHANELLKRGVPADGRDKFGNTPLIIGCQNGHARIIKACLRHNADIDAANRQGNTGLHYCIAYGFNALGDYLISKGANDKVRNKLGLTCYEGIK